MELPHTGANSLSHAPSAGRSLAGRPWLATVAVRGRGERYQARRFDPVTALIAAAVFAAYITIAVVRYRGLSPTSWDLGIFTEYVKQYAHLHAPIVDIRSPGLNLLGDHFHPAVAVLAPFFRLFPTPITLLAAQALLAALSVFPVTRAGAELIGRGAGWAIGAAYGLSWGLQQMIVSDFHEIALAVPLLAWCLSALVRGRYRAAVAWALPLVFVKEDLGFTVAAIGLILAFRYRRPAAGLLLAAWGLAWSLIAIDVIIPYFNPAHQYTYWSLGGGLGPGGGVTPGLLLHQLLAGPAVKLPTLALILLPTAFAALRSPLILAALPGLVLRFVATSSVYWGTGWHYNATLMPVVFVAAIDGLARCAVGTPDGLAGQPAGGAPEPGQAAPPARAELAARLRRAREQLRSVLYRHGPAMMLAISAALAFQFPLSQLWSPPAYQQGPNVRAAWAVMARVPNGASVATDLQLLAPLAARTDTYWLGNYAKNPPTSYIVFDTSSTDWQPPPANVPAFIARWIGHGVPYRLIYRNGGVYLFRRAGGAS